MSPVPCSRDRAAALQGCILLPLSSCPGLFGLSRGPGGVPRPVGESRQLLDCGQTEALTDVGTQLSAGPGAETRRDGGGPQAEAHALARGFPAGPGARRLTLSTSGSSFVNGDSGCPWEVCRGCRTPWLCGREPGACQVGHTPQTAFSSSSTAAESSPSARSLPLLPFGQLQPNCPFPRAPQRCPWAACYTLLPEQMAPSPASPPLENASAELNAPSSGSFPRALGSGLLPFLNPLCP